MIGAGLIAVGMSACGDDGDSNEPAADTTGATDTGALDDTAPDTTTPVDTTAANGCTTTGFVPVAEDAAAAFGAFRYLAQDTLGAPVSVVTFELVEGLGADGPGTYDIVDDNFADCGNCLTISQNCDENLSNCEKAFLAQSGTLEITSWGDSGSTFAGTLSNAVFYEATFGDDLTSTIVDGGDTWCLDSYSFSAVVQ